MSEPVTLVTLFDDLGEVGWHEVGQFVGRAWCATHNVPMVTKEWCYGWNKRKCVTELLPRPVQEPPQ